MFDRPQTGERAVLVHLETRGDPEDLAELHELARSAGADVVGIVTGKRQIPDARYYIGSGKLDEVLNAVREHEAELVLFNHMLTPSQERNIERALGVRVVDRTGLILDIFAQRAQSFEGKLQVELAQLRHLATRLVRGWTHLERQKGGIGLRGPGETQLETDKRLLANRIRLIQKRLGKVVQQRDQGRNARRKADIPVIGLVGYTNAGKSTLFNALTHADVYAADQLFATLDPTLRRHVLANRQTVILADTVGFIRHLPHELVAAFRSTLSEATEADLLLHVIDASDERMAETMAEVENVLSEIGASGVPCIRIFNKIDNIDGIEPRIERDETGTANGIWLSAKEGNGLNLLDTVLEERFAGGRVRRRLELTAGEGAIRAKLYAIAAVLNEEPKTDGGWILELELSQKDMGILSTVDSDGPHPCSHARDMAAE